MSKTLLFLLTLVINIIFAGNLLDPLGYQIYGMYQDRLVMIGGRNETINDGYIQYLNLKYQIVGKIGVLQMNVFCYSKCFDQINDVLYFVSQNKIYSYQLRMNIVNNPLTTIPMDTGFDGDYGCVTVNDNFELYIMGGLINNQTGNNTSDNVQKYSILTGVWHEMAPMINPRSSFTCENYNYSIYIFGGISNFGLLSSIDYHNETLNEWITVNGLVFNGESPRSILIKEFNKIIIIGGYGITNEIFVFDLQTLTLSSQLLSINIPRDGVSLGYHASLISLFICGGKFPQITNETSYTNICSKISLTTSPTLSPTNAPSISTTKAPPTHSGFGSTVLEFRAAIYVIASIIIIIGCCVVTICVTICLWSFKNRKTKDKSVINVQV